MKVKARTTILFERCRRTIRTASFAKHRAYCAGCGTWRMFSLPGAVSQETSIGLRSIFRAIESGALHFIEQEPGSVWICDESAGRWSDESGDSLMDVQEK
jgi:hypothetical protein